MFKARSTKASNERTIAFDLHLSRRQKRHHPYVIGPYVIGPVY